MRLRFLLPLLLALLLAACGDEPTTIIAGDDTTDAAEDAMEDSAVADDSAPFVTTTTGPESLEQPLDEFPRTTVAWEETQADYPLLQHLSDPPGSGEGTGRFVLVDADGTPVFSGSEEFPEFMVTIGGWFGVNNYIEFTIATSNVELIGGQPESTQCNNESSAWLSDLRGGSFQRVDGLPEVLSFDWISSGGECAENLPVAFDSLFDGQVTIAVTDTGLLVSEPNRDAEAAIFERLDPPPVVNPPETTVGPATTAPQTTTTTTD